MDMEKLIVRLRDGREIILRLLRFDDKELLLEMFASMSENALLWSNPPYELTLWYDSGLANVKGLSFDEQGFSLTNDEGGGGYVRPEDMEIPEDD